MTEVQKQTSVTTQELLISTLAQGDALAKLLFEKKASSLSRSSCKRFPRNGRRANECLIQRSINGATMRAIRSPTQLPTPWLRWA